MDTPRRPKLSVTRFRAWEPLVSRRDEWNRLVADSGASIFQTYEWNECWWRCFGQEANLSILIVENDGALLGVAPLSIHRERVNGLRSRVLRFVGSLNHASDYCDFVLAPSGNQIPPEAILDAILKAVFETKAKMADPWDQFELFNFPGHSPHRSALKAALERRGEQMTWERLMDAPTRHLGDPVKDAECLNKKSLKRHLNHFKKAGSLEFWHVESRQEILDYLEPFFQQHIERRALTSDPSQFLVGKQREFYRALVESLGEAGWLRFSVVLFNGQPLAFHFGFEFAGRYLWYKPTFDATHVKKSPGEVLLRFLLEYSIARGLREFDFTVGDEAFKYRFANEVRFNERITVYRAPLAYWLSRLRRQARAILRRANSALSRGEVPAASEMGVAPGGD